MYASRGRTFGVCGRTAAVRAHYNIIRARCYSAARDPLKTRRVRPRHHDINRRLFVIFSSIVHRAFTIKHVIVHNTVLYIIICRVSRLQCCCRGMCGRDAVRSKVYWFCAGTSPRARGQLRS